MFILNREKIIALRMERQYLTRKANEEEYLALYRDLQPGQNVYWNGFGNPPSLTYRANFDDIEYNRERQRIHQLVKGRFAGGNLGWIVPEDMELFACLYRKPLTKPNPRQLALLDLIENEGPLTIQQMKEWMGMLVKEITPALHRLQEAFLIYEDQNEGQADRGWYRFTEMFPDVNLEKYSRQAALKILLQRFAYRMVWFDAEMVKSYFKLPLKDIKFAIESLKTEDILTELANGYLLQSDGNLLATYSPILPNSVYAMHRNDILVKSNEHWLKEKYTHGYPDTLYYLLINGEFRGVVVGKFRYTYDIRDVILDLPKEEAIQLKDEILQAVYLLCGEENIVEKYMGEELLTNA
ncbi:hypothetical protein [Scatolibacter rhodanostii]|uniref:hypothetical protein n=1 Tax=Scatolibacter rhodanostii TaxID=2014781 RepID=UPI001FA82713|nr:hypothetical protein [Scatolibacter rhodanostii]